MEVLMTSAFPSSQEIYGRNGASARESCGDFGFALFATAGVDFMLIKLLLLVGNSSKRDSGLRRVCE